MNWHVLKVTEGDKQIPTLSVISCLLCSPIVGGVSIAVNISCLFSLFKSYDIEFMRI